MQSAENDSEAGSRSNRKECGYQLTRFAVSAVTSCFHFRTSCLPKKSYWLSQSCHLYGVRKGVMLSLLAHTVERVQIQLSIGPCHTNFCTSPHCSITVCYSLISLGSPILASSVDELLLFLSSSTQFGFSKAFRVHASPPLTLPFEHYPDGEPLFLYLELKANDTVKDSNPASGRIKCWHF